VGEAHRLEAAHLHIAIVTEMIISSLEKDLKSDLDLRVALFA